MNADDPRSAVGPPAAARDAQASTPGGPDRYEEFLALFASDRDRIYAYIFTLLGHHADAEDVFQRCSLLLWRKFDRFERGGSFLAWASGVAFYEVRNFLRVARRDRLHFDVDLVTELAECRLRTPDRQDDRLAALGRCLEALRGPERDLIRRVYGGDGSIKDLASAAGQAAQTFYNQISQVRRKLFRCVQRSLATQGG